MVSGETVIEKLKDAKVTLKRGFGVKEIAMYGPHSRGEAQEGDDVMLLVTIDKPLGLRIMDLEEQLKTLLENPVDITLKRDIEKKYLKTIRHELIYA
ncbi:MAG: nucleotidyltransferase [Chitinophagales bacterium]|nr:hypothetical protein [Chitinophagaceae bacterium]MCB9064003.1 nucleotidyltransferase [Chitinophagales bacterium]